MNRRKKNRTNKLNSSFVGTCYKDILFIFCICLVLLSLSKWVYTMDNTIVNSIINTISSICLSVEIIIFLDTFFIIQNRELSIKLCGLLFFFSLAALFILVFSNVLSAFIIFFWINISFILIFTLLMSFWMAFIKTTTYKQTHNKAIKYFNNKRVMVIVPHQDDDINLMGGIIEDLVIQCSHLFFVFITNGDYLDKGEIRINESISLLTSLGINEDHIIFLGYGGEWEKGKPHIYNAYENQIMTSHCGRNSTYGTKEHPPYNNGVPYTNYNFLTDFYNAIIDIHPDVIFCSDYDYHIDHMATSLAFDKVLGNILHNNIDYRPQVFKGFAYSSAWTAPADFYSMNILSTADIYQLQYPQNPMLYKWDLRIRLPIVSCSLSRSLLGCCQFSQLSYYKSQQAWIMSPRIINGDRVFWERKTTSLLYSANIEVSSGDKRYLTDFMLLDNTRLTDLSHGPFDGVWIPDDNDVKKEIRVSFKSSQNIYSVSLYSNPEPDNDIYNAKIVFDDGTVFETGLLDKNGSENIIVVNKSRVTSFCVILDKTTGVRAGLTEIEAYSDKETESFEIIKIIDKLDNFVYDYILEKDKEEFSIYRYGTTGGKKIEYLIESSNPKCKANYDNGSIIVNCPKKTKTILNLFIEGEYVDSIIVRNPGILYRWCVTTMQRIEKLCFFKFSKVYFKSIIFRLPEIIKSRIGRV